MDAFIPCAACKVRVGKDYASREICQEPFGPTLVCRPCFETLRRRKVDVKECHRRDGTTATTATPLATRSGSVASLVQ